MEIWKPVIKYPGYEASSSGRIRSIDRFRTFEHRGKIITQKRRGMFLKPNKRRSGYFKIRLGGGKQPTELLHRIIAETFHENKFAKEHVNHIDGDKSNNAANNLEWCTARENLHHSFRNHLHKTKLAEEDVNAIRFFYSPQKGPNGTTKILAKIFKISMVTARKVGTGVARPWLIFE